MVKASDFKAIQGLIRLHYTRVNPVTITRSNPSALSSPAIPSNGVSQIQPKFSFHRLSSKPTSTNVGLSQILSTPKLNPKLQALDLPRVNLSFSSAFRLVSTKSTGFRKIDGNFARKVVDKPVKAVSSTFARYREAIGLHIEAFWKKNSLVVFGAAGVFVCIFLWRIMFGIASTFVGLSEGMAKYGFLALSSAIVAFSVRSIPSVLLAHNLCFHLDGCSILGAVSVIESQCLPNLVPCIFFLNKMKFRNFSVE